MLWVMLVVIASFVVILAVLLLFIRKRQHELLVINRKLTTLNAELQEANKVKQEYIALFLSILSDNINTSRQYKNHVLKYLRRGNDKYLVDEIEALPPIDDDIDGFYKMFDKTFLNLYPNFVEQFNALLAPGESISPKGNDSLTPELRIFALVKLGISDSSKIASLLHYSANTIYNYRAKIKNKAKGDRDKFENYVKEIE
jgi:DNA-binding CsgD family transcriptional regulator